MITVTNAVLHKKKQIEVYYINHILEVHKNTKSQSDRKSFTAKRLRLTEEKGGLYASIRMTLFCSRVVGLLPLSGLTCETSDKLR